MLQRAHHIEFDVKALLQRMRWGFVCLILCNVVMAQPQAPVVWGEARWMHLAGWPDTNDRMALNCAFLGDTILFVVSATSGFDSFATAVSYDRGQTVNQWQTVPFSMRIPGVVFPAASAGHFYLFTTTDEQVLQIAHSSNAGQTWSGLQFPFQGFYHFGAAAGMSVYRSYLGRENQHWVRILIHSSNGGVSWESPDSCQGIDIAEPEEGWDPIACTRNHVLMVDEADVSDPFPYGIYCAIARRDDHSFNPYTLLPGQPEGRAAMGFTICGDSTNETAGVLSYISDIGSTAPHEPFIQMTHDGGLTWGPCISLSGGERVIPSVGVRWPALLCSGKLWMAFWLQYHQPNNGRYWAAVRFSANHGRNWYPVQMAADSIYEEGNADGLFDGNRIQIIWAENTPSLHGTDFHNIEGTLSPDTVAPVLSYGEAPPEEIVQGSTVDLLSTASDNDSLPYIQVVLKQQGSNDSIVVNLSERVSSTDYRGTWTVPNDTALWQYYYRAEDMWENVSVYPDTGVFSFHTTGWNAANPLGPHPSSFSLSAFPNPFNSTTRISFSLPHRENISLCVYDVTGRLKETMVKGIYTGGEHEIEFDGRGLASGIYFVRLRTSESARVKKMVLPK